MLHEKTESTFWLSLLFEGNLCPTFFHKYEISRNTFPTGNMYFPVFEVHSSSLYFSCMFASFTFTYPQECRRIFTSCLPRDGFRPSEFRSLVALLNKLYFKQYTRICCSVLAVSSQSACFSTSIDMYLRVHSFTKPCLRLAPNVRQSPSS